MNVDSWRALALSGYFATFALTVAWQAWLAPSTRLPVAVMLLAFGLPLLAPLRGLLHGRRYTYAWSLFLVWIYFAHGVIEAYSDPSVRVYGLLEIVFSAMWFVGGIGYVRSVK